MSTRRGFGLNREACENHGSAGSADSVRRKVFNAFEPGSDPPTGLTKGNLMALMQPHLIRAVAARANLGEAEAGRALSALEEILLEEVLGAVTRRVTGLVQTALGLEPPRMQATDRNLAIAARSESSEPEDAPIKASRGGSRRRVAAEA